MTPRKMRPPVHQKPHPLAGQTAVLPDGVGDPVRNMVIAAEEFRVEDYGDRVTGGRWGDAAGNYAAMQYAMRIGLLCDQIPPDNVVYGKIGAFGHLVHVTELPGNEPA
ncbi:MAG: hypothetical protein ACRDTZ_01190 [Pseudonocardiaceae bacterium]